MREARSRGGGEKREKERKTGPRLSEESAESKSDVYGENYTL